MPHREPALPDFQALPLWSNAAIFLAAAGVVWMAGTKIARYADAIAIRTGLSYAVVGMLLLGGITSLPELAVSVSAGLAGNAALAVNNIFGGVALQVVVIVIGDAVLRGRALTFVTGSPTVLLQGVFCTLLLGLAIIGMAAGDVPLLGAGAWTIGIFLAALACFRLVSHYRGNETWQPAEPLKVEEEASQGQPMPLGRAIVLTALAGAAIVAAGYLLARTGEALAEQTGLGASFVGLLFVGLSTSLPEISTVIAAVRLRRYLMAFSDIFGTNILDIAMLLAIDLSFAGPPVLTQVGPFSIVAAALAGILTLTYVAGLIERQDRQLAGLGLDSWVVLLLYAGGVSLLYTLRGG